MPIEKAYQAPNFAATTFHAIKRATVEFGTATARVDVQSFPSEDAFNAGVRPVWSTPVVIDLGDLPSFTAANIEAWLLEHSDPFMGGTIV